MACQYTYQGKTHSLEDFAGVLSKLQPEEAAKFMPGVSALPNAPFIGSTDAWSMLAMKRMVRYAAENGFDRIGWTTGDQQNARYPADGAAGEKIAKGMESFYDRMLPNEVNKWAKPFGAKVGDTAINGKHVRDQFTYTGPEHSLDAIENAMKVAKSGGPGIHESPLTGKKTHFIFNRVANEAAIRPVLEAMRAGDSFKDAVEKSGANLSPYDVEDIFGGTLKHDEITSETGVHSLDITPAMRKAALDGLPLFSFAGEHANTADHGALAQAKQMEAIGRDSVPDRFGNQPGSAEDTHAATGWHRGVDGKWRFEIDDSAATVKTDALKDIKIKQAMISDLIKRRSAAYANGDQAAHDALTTRIKEANQAYESVKNPTLDKVLDHPALFAAYPDLAKVNVRVDPEMTSWGSYSPKTGDITIKPAGDYPKSGNRSLKSVLMHEIQHAIQDHEGFARGGSPAEARTLPEFEQLLAQRMMDAKNEVPSWTEVQPHMDDVEEETAHAVYRRLAGETEARNTQKRLDLSAEDRRATPPSETQDVSRGDQIVRFNGKAAHDVGDRAPVSQRLAEHTKNIEAQVGEIRKAWKGDDAPTIKVVPDPEHLPEFAKKEDGYERARGMYDGKTLYVVASAHPDTAAGAMRLRETIAHEAVGHYGIDRIVTRELGASAWDKIESSVARLEEKGLGGDRMQSVIAEVRRRYGNDIDAATFARETLAVMAEHGVRNGLLDRAVAAIRAFIRRVMPDLKLSERELRQLLVKSDEYLHTGESYGQRVQATQAMAFSRENPPEHFKPEAGSSDQFRKDLRRTMISMRTNEPPIKVSDMPDVMKALGVRDVPIMMSRDVVRKATNGVKHHIPMSAIERLPEELHDPLAVFHSATEKGSLVVLTEERDLNNSPMVVAMDVRPTDKSFDVTRISSVYGKDSAAAFTHWAKEGLLAYKSDRAEKSPVLKGLQLPDSVSGDQGKVLSEADIASSPKATADSATMALDPDTLRKMRGRFGTIEGWWKQQFGHGFDGLTESEARAALTFDKGRLSADGLRNRVTAGKIPEIGRVGEAATGDRPGAEAPGSAGRVSDKPPRADFSKAEPEETNDRGQPMKKGKPTEPFSRSSDSIETIDEQLGTVERNVLQKATDWVAGKAQDWKPFGLGWIHLRHVAELAEKIPEIGVGAKRYVDTQQRMQAMRHSMEEAGGKKAEALQKFSYERGPAGWLGKMRPVAKHAFRFAHKLTQVDIDPTSAYERLMMPDSRGEMHPWTEDMRRDRIKALQAQMRGRSGDDKTAMMEEVKALKQLPRREKTRAARYPQMVKEWNKLPKESQDMIMMMRDHYKDTAERMMEANVGQIRANTVLPDATKRVLEKSLRDRHAQAMMNGVYFPLKRFGDYWISGRMKDTVDEKGQVQPGQYFHMRMENAADQARKERQLQANGASIEASGRADGKYEASKAPSGTFVADTLDTLRKAGAPPDILDQVYQNYLKTMPELALSKHYIHRNNVAGYTDDVPRIFASHVQHAAIQIARATYSHELNAAMTQMEESLDAARRNSGSSPSSHQDFRGFMDAVISRYENDPKGEMDAAKSGTAAVIPPDEIKQHVTERANEVGSDAKAEQASRKTLADRYNALPQSVRERYADQAKTMFGGAKPPEDSHSVADIAHADALVSELGKRHQWLMNPTDSKWANQVNALSYLYFLGASPASAVVNLVQVPQIVLPVLGARHGWAAATRVLAKSMKEAFATRGNMDQHLTGDELKAFQQLHDTGTFQRTQTHMLAGMGSGDQLRANPALAKVMHAISWMFQTSEVVNRTGTGMAAYRLGREQGMVHDAAVKYADEMTNGTHGDYSNANRSRHMQHGVMKVATQFKSYGIAMGWLWGREMYKAFKGETPEVKALARKTLTGLVGMTGLFAGVAGLPMFNAMKYTASAAHAVFGDDDEPWDFDTEFRGFLAQWLGKEGANLVADGAANKVLGVNLASRVGQSDLFFHDDNKQMNNQQAVENFMVSLFGPIGGIAQNVATGMDQIDKGSTTRGIETMMPTFAKNAMKSYRYATQGVNTLQGAPIVDDVNGLDDFRQLIGFQPTRVADQQRDNNVVYNSKEFIIARRKSLVNAYALAQSHGDAQDVGDSTQAIANFNQKWPQAPIRMSDLRQSLRGRAWALAESENGVRLSGRIGAAVKARIAQEDNP